MDAVGEIIENGSHDPFDPAYATAKIGSESADEPGKWKSFARDLQDAQEGDPNRSVRMPLVCRTHSSQARITALELHVSTFRPELWTVLLTAAICESQYWIPEVVFEIFFKHLHSSLASFSDCKAELITSDLIKIERENVQWRDIPRETISVHDRCIEFFDITRKNQLDAMVRKLLGRNSTSDDGTHIIICVLLVLYAQKAWRDEAASRLNISIDENNLASAVKPFVWLLHARGEEEWQKQSHRHATEVILQYLRNGELDDHAVSKLLSLQEAAADTCGALYTMALLVHSDDSKSLLTGRHVNTVKGLLKILRNDVDSTNKRVAMDALEELACEYRSATDSGESIVPLILAQPLDWFLTLLKPKVKHEITIRMQSSAFRILGYLAQRTANDANLIDKLLPGIWKYLVNAISKDMDSTVQIGALSAVAGLYSNSEVSSRLAAIPDALNSVLGGLVVLLDKDVSSDVQTWAVLALKRMTEDSLENQVKIASFAGVLEGLVRLLAKDASGDVQQWAAGTLANFTNIDNNNSIGSFPGVVKALVGLLARDIDHDIKAMTTATMALADMSGNALENPVKIGSFPGAIEGLVGLLAMDVSWEAQLPAIVALSFLMNITPGAVEGFMESPAENPKTVEAHVRRTIAAMPAALEHLVKLLATPELRMHPFVQHEAALLLTLVDFGKAEDMILQSRSAYGGRGLAKSELGMYHEALEDLDICLKDFESESETAQSFLGHIFSHRVYVRAMLQDYGGALDDADRLIESCPHNPYVWQNRGVLKRMMQDLDGALADLNKSLELGGRLYNTVKDYNVFKHRGYIKHLKGDQKGAREDGEMATRQRSSRAIQPGIGWPALGHLTVKYLEFEL